MEYQHSVSLEILHPYLWLDLWKPSLKAHFVFWEISIWNIEATVIHLCYNVAWPDTQHKSLLIYT